MRRLMNRPAGLLVAAMIGLGGERAEALDYAGEGRKTTARDFAVDVQRIELPNGLVVLLSPEPTASSVLVWMTFRAGTVYEPRGRSGLAHLVEHVMANGPTAETDYAALLERRRARDFNATTGFDSMTFETSVPPGELPAALWVAADRIGSLPALIDDALVERHRRVVLQERAIRDVDAPYGLVREHLFSRLYAAPHPLHGAIVGTPGELARVTAADVRSFAGALLVPANAILTVVGRFDPLQARRLIEDGLGRLPAGRRARIPSLAPLSQALLEMKEEAISREPRVSLAWRFPHVPHDEATALELGAQLLSFLTDGAWGMRLHADLEEYAFESVFRVDLTVPYDEPIRAVQGDVDAFLRQLTQREMSFELLLAANLALDRKAMFDLDTLEGRAGRLSRLERLFGSKVSVSQDLSTHWMFDPPTLRDTARVYLGNPRVVVHARPVRPRPARVERE